MYCPSLYLHHHIHLQSRSACSKLSYSWSILLCIFCPIPTLWDLLIFFVYITIFLICVTLFWPFSALRMLDYAYICQMPILDLFSVSDRISILYISCTIFWLKSTPHSCLYHFLLFCRHFSLFSRSVSRLTLKLSLSFRVWLCLKN